MILESYWQQLDALAIPTNTSGLYYKHMTIVNYVSSIVNKLKALHTDDARVVIYDRHVSMVQATGFLPSIVWYC
jgi:hypothetical protein